MPTPAQVIEAYVTTRDQIDAISERHKDELAPYRDKLDKLSSWLQGTLSAQGAQNIKTEHGTAFLKTATSVKVLDPEAFFGFVETTGEEQLVERKPNSAAVKDYIAEHHGDAPPGVEISTVVNLQVRRA